MRDPARNPHEALRRYKHVLQQALGLVGQAQWITGEQQRATGLQFLSTKPFPLRLPVAGGGYVYLGATQLFTYERSRKFRSEWKVKTEQYIYSLGTGPAESDLLVAWHWHPGLREDCHLHVYREDDLLGPLRRLHFPTRRVSFEQVIGFLITDLEVPGRIGWREVLDECQKRFEEFRSWS